jgi:translation initiation factor 1
MAFPNLDFEKHDPFGGINTITQMAGPKEKIHIRFYQQGKRAITMIEGLDDDLDQKRIAKALKRAFSCASSVHIDEASGKEVIKLQGDQVHSIKEWLVAQEILTQKEAGERLVLHGQ